MDGSRRIAVGSRYVLHADGTVGFALARFDRTKALVIDPILSYSRLLGGCGLDEAVSVAVDAAGNVYLAGTTSSAGFGGAPGGPAGIDVFVTKLDARGSTVLFSTYIGGSGVDEARGMTLDTLGNVYVVGSTTSTNFPTASPRQAALGRRRRRLPVPSDDRRRARLLHLFRRQRQRRINAIAVDAGRNMYIAGTTRSAELPACSTHPALRRRPRRLRGALHRRRHPHLLDLPRRHGVDTLEGIGVDGAGNVNRRRLDDVAEPAGHRGAAADLAGNVDAFFSRFSVNGDPGLLLVLRRHRPTTSRRAVAELASGWAFIAGSTSSPDFPVVSAIQPTFGGGWTPCCSRSRRAARVAWATFYGGTRSERGRALAVNPSGKLIFAGQTFSPDMPLVRPPRRARAATVTPSSSSSIRPTRRSPTRPISAAATTTREGRRGRRRRPRLHRRHRGLRLDAGAAGPSDAFIYGISSGLAGADTDGDGLPDDWETQFGLDPNTNDAAADPDGDGFTNAQECANHTHPTGYFTRYLAEGSTGAFFDDRIALFNPNADIATVVLRFQRDAGGEIQQTMRLPARSRPRSTPS